MAKSTAVCDEALSNIRTVRAFAMEDKEMELYAAELEKARIMQENLGMGIGLFQVGRKQIKYAFLILTSDPIHSRVLICS